MSSICAPSKKKTSHSYCHIITHHCPHACRINIDEKTTALSVSLWMSLWCPNEDLWQVPHKPPPCPMAGFLAHKSQVCFSAIKGNRNLWHIKQATGTVTDAVLMPWRVSFYLRSAHRTPDYRNTKPELLSDTEKRLCLSVPLMIVPEKAINDVILTFSEHKWDLFNFSIDSLGQ